MKTAESHFACSAVYCKPLGQQKKHKYSFPQAPGFCTEGIFVFAMYFGADYIKSKKISSDQELIQSDPTSCPINQVGNN